MNERHAQKQRSRPRTAQNSPPKFKTLQPGPVNERRNSFRHQIQPHPHQNSAKPFDYSAPGAKDHFRDIRNILDAPRATDEDTRRQVGLSLELEIDESLRDLLQLASNDKTHAQNISYNNKSLDVTFIQQADSQHQTTVSLGVDEVSQLIDMVNAKGNGNVTVAPPKSPESPTHQEDFPDYYTTTDDEFSDDLYERGIVPPNNQQVYTAPQHTYDQIKTKLPCMAKVSHDEHEKPGTPCLCQHCGMVGVLVESQKRPAIPHTPHPRYSGYPNNSSGGTSTAHHSRRKVPDERKSKSETNLQLLKELTGKIATLEERLAAHEEKTVRKDYFKFVIHKLLTQYSNKINELRNATLNITKPNTNISTQYSKKNVNILREERKSAFDAPERDHNRYYPVKVGGGTNSINRKSSTDECSVFSSDRYYRKVHRSKAPKKSANTSATRNDILKLTATKLDQEVKNVYVANETTVSTNPFDRVSRQEVSPEAANNLSAHAIKNLCDMVYNKYCDAGCKTTEPPEKLRSSNIRSDGRLSCPAHLPSADARNSSPPHNMAVSYMNPALRSWHDESEQEFPDSPPAILSERARRFSKPHADAPAKNKPPANKHTNHTIEEKIRYLKYLARRKNVDEAELWTNILNQAKRHIKSNDDTVSIQLPNLVDGPEMSELELTLSKLKEIVKKSRAVRKNASGFSISLNTRTSSECFKPFATLESPRKTITR